MKTTVTLFHINLGLFIMTPLALKPDTVSTKSTISYYITGEQRVNKSAVKHIKSS